MKDSSNSILNFSYGFYLMQATWKQAVWDCFLFYNILNPSG